MGKGGNLGEFEEIVLLSVAGLGSDGHGATIHEAILEATDRDVSIASVYVTLSRLEQKGLARSGVAPANNQRGGRPRKTFGLAEEGVAQLRRSRMVQERLWRGLAFDPAVSERGS